MKTLDGVAVLLGHILEANALYIKRIIEADVCEDNSNIHAVIDTINHVQEALDALKVVIKEVIHD